MEGERLAAGLMLVVGLLSLMGITVMGGAGTMPC